MCARGYAIDVDGARRFPAFQFSDRSTLPGLAQVLHAISPDAYPVGVAKFFLLPTADLEAELFDTPVSPRDWLLAGLPVEPVVALATTP